MSELHVWKIDEAETFWVIAASKEDAAAVLFESDMIEDYASPAEYIAADVATFAMLNGNSPLTCTGDDGPEKETRTCAEWAKDGRGMIGSTVY